MEKNSKTKELKMLRESYMMYERTKKECYERMSEAMNPDGSKKYSQEEIKELIKKNTRNYAKRQITFFKRLENHTLLTPEDATVENVLQLLK